MEFLFKIRLYWIVDEYNLKSLRIYGNIYIGKVAEMRFRDVFLFIFKLVIYNESLFNKSFRLILNFLKIIFSLNSITYQKC